MAQLHPWLPPLMEEAEQQYWLDRFPTKPHLSAGYAWESWAAQIEPPDPSNLSTAAVASVSTGGQSISYATPKSEWDDAMSRAQWHFARSHTAVMSPDYPLVAVPPCYSRVLPPTWKENGLTTPATYGVGP